MESSSIGYRMIQVFGLLFGAMPLMFIQSYFWTEAAIAEVDLGKETFLEIGIFFIFCTGMAFFSYSAFTKAVFIRFSDENIRIKGFRRNETIQWNDVKRVFKVPFASPPIYRISFNETHKTGYFIMSLFNSWTIETPWSLFSGDSSGVVKYARDKISNARHT